MNTKKMCFDLTSGHLARQIMRMVNEFVPTLEYFIPPDTNMSYTSVETIGYIMANAAARTKEEWVELPFYVWFDNGQSTNMSIFIDMSARRVVLSLD